MEHSTDYFIGLVIGILVGLAAVFVIGKIFKKKRGPCKYDERQTLARGKAYKTGFWTFVGYLLLNGLLNAADIIWADTSTAAFLGLFLGIAVYAIVCILNDAYLPLKEKPGFYFAIFGLVIVVNLAVTILNFSDGTEFITDKMLNYHSLNAGIVIMFIAVIITLAVRQIIAKKDADEE